MVLAELWDDLLSVVVMSYERISPGWIMEIPIWIVQGNLRHFVYRLATIWMYSSSCRVGLNP